MWMGGFSSYLPGILYTESRLAEAWKFEKIARPEKVRNEPMRGRRKQPHVGVKFRM